MTQPLPDLTIETPEERRAAAERYRAETRVALDPEQPEQPTGPVIGTKAFDARRREAETKQAELEARNRKVDTVTTQFTRGVFSALTAPGALFGAAVESAGELTGSKALADFGRDVGESATGSAALESLTFVFGGEQKEALSASDRMRRDIREQEQAYPTLSLVSQMAGGIAAGVAVGAAGGAAGMVTPTTAQYVGAGAFEGAAAGAQGAYERQAPLRDVLVSTLVGTALGGAVAGAPGVLKSVKVRKGLEKFAGRRGFKAIGGTGSNLKNLAREFDVAEEKLYEVVDTAMNFKFPDGRKVFKPGADFGEHAHAFGEALDQVGKELGAIRDGADDVIQKLHPEFAPNVNEIAERVQKRVINPLLARPSSAVREEAKPLLKWVDDLKKLPPELKRVAAVKPENIPKWKEFTKGKMGPYMKSEGSHGAAMKRLSAEYKDLMTGKGGQEIIERGERTSIAKLYELRRDLDAKLYESKQARVALGQMGVSPAEKNLEKIRMIYEEAIEEATDKTKKYMKDPLNYEALKRDYHNLGIAKKIAGSAELNELGRRFFSPSDTATGLITAAGGLAAGGPAGLATVKGMAAGAIHRAIRRKGSGYLAVTAARLARMGGGEAAGAIGARQAGRAGQSLLPGAIKGELTTGLLTDTVTQEVIGGQASEALQGARTGSRLAASRGAGGLAAVFGERAQLPEVPLELAGGREGQEVLTAVQRARQSVQDAEEQAGPNPDQRQAARQVAQEQAVNRLAEQAGEYDPAEWRSKKPTPLQKAIYRTPLLDRIADEISRDATEAPKPPPVQINPDRLKQLTSDADGPTAIGTVQDAVNELLEQTPPTVDGFQMAYNIRRARERLGGTDVAGSMLVTHELVESLLQTAATATDPTTQSWATRQAAMLRQTLGSEPFGTAGAAYGMAYSPPAESFAALSDPAQAREILRRAETKGVMLQPLSEQREAALEAATAIEILSGERGAKREIAKQYKELEQKFAEAEDAVLFDGAGPGRLRDYFADQLDNRVQSALGDDITRVTANAIRPKLQQLAPLLQGVAEPARDLPEEYPTRATLAEFHRDRLETLEELMGDDDTMAMVQEGLRAFPGVSGDLQASVGQDMGRILGQLYQDLPKPEPDIRGNAYASLSSDDLRKGEAYWAATMDPMGIVDDFQNGMVDYDRVAYTQKQYPGLMLAAQAGLMDILTSQMDSQELEGIPEPILTQVDYLFGFNGRLQSSVDHAFSQRMEQVAEQDKQARNQPGGGGGGRLSLPSAETNPQRIARGRA